MSAERDGFLNRWSRLKREAVEAKPEPRKSAEAETPAQVEPAEFDPAHLEIPLPSLDDLKPGDTLVAFMQKGVPEALRNAALRKMWALDPMVRDFKSEALDYAWDWNTPGGVPGAGPLGPADQVQDMVEALFRPANPTEDAAPPPSPADAEAASDGTQPAKPSEPAEAAPVAPADDSEPPAAPETEATSAEIGPRKRHGGAMPQV